MENPSEGKAYPRCVDNENASMVTGATGDTCETDDVSSRTQNKKKKGNGICKGLKKGLGLLNCSRVCSTKAFLREERNWESSTDMDYNSMSTQTNNGGVDEANDAELGCWGSIILSAFHHLPEDKKRAVLSSMMRSMEGGGDLPTTTALPDNTSVAGSEIAGAATLINLTVDDIMTNISLATLEAVSAVGVRQSAIPVVAAGAASGAVRALLEPLPAGNHSTSSVASVAFAAAWGVAQGVLGATIPIPNSTENSSSFTSLPVAGTGQDGIVPGRNNASNLSVATPAMSGEDETTLHFSEGSGSTQGIPVGFGGDSVEVSALTSPAEDNIGQGLFANQGENDRAPATPTRQDSASGSNDTGEASGDS